MSFRLTVANASEGLDPCSSSVVSRNQRQRRRTSRGKALTDEPPCPILILQKHRPQPHGCECVPLGSGEPRRKCISALRCIGVASGIACSNLFSPVIVGMWTSFSLGSVWRSSSTAVVGMVAKCMGRGQNRMLDTGAPRSSGQETRQGHRYKTPGGGMARRTLLGARGS